MLAPGASQEDGGGGRWGAGASFACWGIIDLFEYESIRGEAWNGAAV